MHQTCSVARQIEQANGLAVMPVMVVYTANASGGVLYPILPTVSVCAIISAVSSRSAWRRKVTRIKIIRYP